MSFEGLQQICLLFVHVLVCTGSVFSCTWKWYVLNMSDCKVCCRQFFSKKVLSLFSFVGRILLKGDNITLIQQVQWGCFGQTARKKNCDHLYESLSVGSRDKTTLVITSKRLAPLFDSKIKKSRTIGFIICCSFWYFVRFLKKKFVCESVCC